LPLACGIYFLRANSMRYWFVLMLLGSFVVNSINITNAADQEKIGFNKHIRPILSNKCFACHGFDAGHREADLRLDIAEGAFADLGGHAAIVPGNVKASELWRRINATDESEIMPPPESHKEITAEDKALIKAWIEQGAPYQLHWAFEPPVDHPVPEIQTVVGNSPSEISNLKPEIRNPIDAFLAARLQAEGLTMSPEADKPTLIRRVAFALTGLPPKVTEVDEFVADTSPDAYEKMVERYLASPHYGEEMARHWLDVARYGDTHGLHLDNERQMWAYRDWVVGAFNRNLPFDQFTVEQLAGDLLPNPSVDQLVATGFNRCNVTTSEGGSINEELLFRYAVDRASTTAQTWLGLTAGCAACHDHKFDPITQKEFYSLYAFFNSAADPAMDGNALLTNPVLKLETDASKQKLAEFDQQIAAKSAELQAAVAALDYRDPAELDPPPAPQIVEQVWFDDEFAANGKASHGPGSPTQYITADNGQVFSGQKALKRSDEGISQDVWSDASVPLVIPSNAKLFAYVWIDPAKPPKAVMLQYHSNSWRHRAVWGDAAAIDWGAINTEQRLPQGELPTAGTWVKLEVPAELLGLKNGDQLTGFAMTQYGGTVYWDKVGVAGDNNPATDPQRSFKAWWNSVKGKDSKDLPGDLQPLAKAGPEGEHPPEQVAALRAHYLQTICVDSKAQLGDLPAAIKKLQDERTAYHNAIPSTFVFKDLEKPRPSFVMMRGAYDKPGDAVEPGVPAIMPPLKKSSDDARASRLDLARWLVAPENPLTARVTVNRFWQQFFGKGLVKTSYDFGSQGEVPSHPELLDWLALNLQRNNWDVKALVRMLVTSAAFRQQTMVTPALLAKDPDNRLYARGPRFRLDAEQVRDNALAVSGLLNRQLGGVGVKPYQPPNIWEPVGFTGSNTRIYKQDTGDALYRRSLYVFFKRTAPPPFMTNFDAPNREQFCTVRERSNTPLQALQLMNDVQHVEAARVLAERMLTEGGTDAPQRIAFAYRTVLARSPEADELAVIEQQLSNHLQRYSQDAEAAGKLISHGETKPRQELAAPELAAYTLVANMILNLDETVNRN
jgi:hypothetical protein